MAKDEFSPDVKRILGIFPKWLNPITVFVYILAFLLALLSLMLVQYPDRIKSNFSISRSISEHTTVTLNFVWNKPLQMERGDTIIILLGEERDVKYKALVRSIIKIEQQQHTKTKYIVKVELTEEPLNANCISFVTIVTNKGSLFTRFRNLL